MKFEMKNHLKPCAAISAVIILIALVMTLTGNGMNLGVDFTGGELVTFEIGEAFNANDIENLLKEKNIDVASVAQAGDNQVQIRVASNADSETLTDTLSESMNQALSEKYTNVQFINVSYIGAVAGKALISNAIKSVVFAAILMLIYIAFRFDFYSGVSAVIGLIHDILVMISFTVIFHSFIRVETTFIAALLTIVGYSINNTIIIFDRIRENSHKVGVRNLAREEIVNRSITESLPRTLNTTITTLITIVVLYILGVDSVKQFALPLIIGILAGTYSANLINGYVWAGLMDLRSASRKKAKA